MATEVNKILLEVELDASGVVKNSDQVNAQLQKLGVNADLVNKKLKGTKDASGAAGAAVAEFGRLVSDAPYGIQAVTNNLSQLGSMFAVTAANAGGAKNALGEMLNVVFKAGRVTMVGWLIAFQAVIAAIDYFTRSTKKAKEEFAEFNIETESQVLNLNEVLRALNSNNASVQKQVELLRALSGINEDLIDLYEQGKISQEEITLAVQAQLAVAEAKKKLGEDDKVLLNEINKINEETTDLQDQLAKKREVLNKITDKSVNKEIRRKELTADIESLEGKIAANGEKIDKKLIGRNDTLIEIVRAQAVLTNLEDKYLEDTEKVVEELKEIKLLWGEIGTTFDQLAEGRKFLLRLGFDFDSAEDMLIQAGENAADELQKRVESKGERDPFVDFFGFSQENFQKSAERVQEGLNTAFDLITSQYDRELALEESKTIALNDQLRERLRNEELTAEARDKINQEIAKNEALLVERQNEIEEKRFKLNKAQGIANAVINTAVGVSKVLPNIPLAAFIGALGAAQIATIASQQFVPTPSPTPSLTAQGGGALAGEEVSPQFNVIGATGQNQLAAAIASMQQQPVKAYVVSGDVTTAQSLDRNIITEAGI